MIITLPIFARVPKNTETETKVYMLTPQKVLRSQSQKTGVKAREESGREGRRIILIACLYQTHRRLSLLGHL